MESNSIKIDRLAGAEAISARARTIGEEMGIVISDCVWDLGEDYKSQHAHRLDLFAGTATARLYFPDVELTTSGNEARASKIDDRLRSAIAQLLPRVPQPTYACSRSAAP